MTSSLPTPRHLLTSLLTSLFDISHTPAIPSTVTEPNYHSARNDASSHISLDYGSITLPPEARTLLTTLHVLIPPPTLLQSLNLLDRRLVTRVVHDSLADDPTCEPLDRAESGSSPNSRFYVVRSAQQHGITTHRRSISSARATVAPDLATLTHGLAYIVRLEAWNCSCAAFTFSALPHRQERHLQTSFDLAREELELGMGKWYEEDEEEEGVVEHESHVQDDLNRKNRTQPAIPGPHQRKSGPEAGAWEFGGLSVDGRTEGGVLSTTMPPLCKHLLACLLAEKWHGVLGTCLWEVHVGREDMAGIAGEL